MIPNIIIPMVPQNKRKGIASTNITNELAAAIRLQGQFMGAAGAGKGGLIQVRIRIAANLTGGGKYSGYFRNMPTATISVDTDVSDADVGTNGQPCYIINTVERGQSTHDLTETPVQVKEFVGHLLPQSTDGIPWVEINGYDIYTCT